MELENARNLKEYLKRKLRLDAAVEPVIEKEAMAHQIGATAVASRDLKWNRFVPGTPLPVPQVMRDELERLMLEFRASFAPYAQSPAVKKLYGQFKDMVFAWYACDASVTPDDIQNIQQEPDLDPQVKQQLMHVAEFVQNNGIQLLRSGNSDDPSSSKFGNLNDRHLSHYGYAYADLVPVREGKPSVPMGSTPFEQPTTPDPWVHALTRQGEVPDFYGRLFDTIVGKTSTGANALFARFRTPDRRGDRVIPITDLAGDFNPDAPDSYKGLAQFFVNRLEIGKQFVYAPNRERGPLKLMVGRHNLLRNNIAKNLHHWNDYYKDDSADAWEDQPNPKDPSYQPIPGRWRYEPHYNKKKQHVEHIFQLKFADDEGGLVAYNKRTGEAFNLSPEQVKYVKDPGEMQGRYTSDGRSPIYKLLPARQPVDADGQPKHPGYGRWDIAEADRQHLRQTLKPLMDMLGDLTLKYRGQRATREDYRPHTPQQTYKWIVVAPRFQIADVLPGGKAKAFIFNRKFVPPKKGTQEGEAGGEVAASAGGEVKTAIHRLEQPSEGIRNWVVITHDVNVQKQQKVGGKRFPYEAMGGNSTAEFNSAVEAITYAFNAHRGNPSFKLPDARRVQAADAVFKAAVQEVQQMNVQPSMDTPEMRQEMAEMQKQDQLAGTRANVPQGQRGRNILQPGQQLSLFEQPQANAQAPLPQKLQNSMGAPIPVQQPGQPVAQNDPVNQTTASAVAKLLMRKYGI